MSEKLEVYRELMTIIPKLFNEEISISLANDQVFLDTLISKEVPLEVAVGKPLPTGGAVREALDTGRVVDHEVPADVYGVAFHAYAFPIKESGKIIGVLGVGRSLKNKKAVLEKAATLVESLEQSTKAIDEIANTSQFLSETNQEISDTAKMTADKTKEIEKVIAFVKEVSKKINMLGVNASITAAHAGGDSKGFEVISKEIRNLSGTTAESVNEIEKVLWDIQASVNHFSAQIDKMLLSLNDQSAATEEVLASMEEINSAADTMKEMAASL